MVVCRKKEGKKRRRKHRTKEKYNTVEEEILLGDAEFK